MFPDPSEWRRCSRPRKHSLCDGQTVIGFDVGQIHMGRCVLKFNSARRPPISIVSWRMANLGTGTVALSATALVTRVKASPEEWTADYAVIEQQDRVNTKMIAMSHALQVCLMFNGVDDVSFASSACKFAVFRKMPGLDGTLIKGEPKSLSHAKRKKIRKQNSIDVVKAVLGELPYEEVAEFIHLLADTPADQRDDLADAFVYALAFIYKNEPAPEIVVVNNKKRKAHDHAGSNVAKRLVLL